MCQAILVDFNEGYVFFKNYFPWKLKVLLFLYAILPFFMLCCQRDSDMRQDKGNVCFHMTSQSNIIWLLVCSLQLNHLLCAVPCGCRLPQQDSQARFPKCVPIRFQCILDPPFARFLSLCKLKYIFPFLINSLPPHLW